MTLRAPTRASALNEWLWQRVERAQRRPRWQRLMITSVWIAAVVGGVYLWVSLWDCPIC